jgi:hypothetical protein
LAVGQKGLLNKPHIVLGHAGFFIRSASIFANKNGRAQGRLLVEIRCASTLLPPHSSPPPPPSI